ncbi:MAG: surface lipoprotein assembly modifier [Methylophilaceae bacterium]
MNSRFQKGLLVLALSSALSAMAAGADLPAAKALLESGKPAEAYTALEPFEFDMAGNQDFDYLLAVAALDSGHPEKAILIFDRVLSVNPQFAGARLDLARAYFELKSDAAAREQFELVQADNPPEPAKSTIAKYLAALDARATNQTSNFKGYTEFVVGYDSNSNASTSDANIFVPALGATLTLSASNLETSSKYFSAGAGGEYTHVVSPKIKLFIGGDIKKRQNPDATAFGTGSLDAHAGIRYGEEDNNVTVTAQRGRFYLAGDPNRDTYGVSAQWALTVHPQLQVSLFGVFTASRYVPVGIQANDSNLGLAGISWLYAVDPEAKTIISTSAFLGKDAEDKVRADGSKDFRGLRVAAQHRLRDDIALYGSVGVQLGDYDTVNVAFNEKREDRQYDAAAGVSWKVNDAWSVRPQVSYTRNNSNIAIYQYDRKDASVTVRWDFR